MYPARLISLALSRLEKGDDLACVGRGLGLHVSVLRRWQTRYDGMSLAEIAACQDLAFAKIEAIALRARKSYEDQNKSK